MAPVLTAQPSLPSLADYTALLQGVWDRQYLSNNGPLVQQLEAQLSQHWCNGLPVVLVGNGTLALQLVAEALNWRGGAVVTTPLSFVATTAALVWQGVQPVFAEVDGQRWMPTAHTVAAALSPQTKGVLLTHLYGYPAVCDELLSLAKARDLPVVFDGAHAFGATWRGQPLVTVGDATVLSFHATKLFHTAEGGAIVTPHRDLAETLRQLRTFGQEALTGQPMRLGINAKLSELHAALGLALLPQVPAIMAHRQTLAAHYDARLAHCPGLLRPVLPQEATLNGAYYPIACRDEATVLRLLERLKQANVMAKRYFYPPLHHLAYVGPQPTLPIAEALSPRLLCLPLHAGLSTAQVNHIADCVLEVVSTVPH